jgi:hypothetical protein
MSDIRYWTFPDASTAEITRRLIAAGPGALLRLVPASGEHGPTLAVIHPQSSAAAVAEAPVNEAHPCPPFC